MSVNLRVVLLAGAAVAGAAGSVPAYADGPIERVVVTAQKRLEDVQKVPISMKALTGNQLDERGINGFADLKYQVPSLTFGGQVTGGENFITLRGVGNENLTGGGDPGVAYHSDGVYLGRTVGVDESFFDVERIEVLRGPQGTLYGRNSTGGAINVITRKPDLDKYEGAADVTIGNYGFLRTRAMVNLPLNDSVAVRFAGVINQRDGYQENLLSSSVCGDCEGDAADNFNVRGHLYFKLSESADLLVSGAAFENNEPVAIKIREPFPTNLTGFPNNSPFFGFATNRYTGALLNPADPRKVRKDFEDGLDMNTRSVSATLNWDIFPGVTLTSITGYQKLHWDQSSDGDGSELPLAFTNYWRNDSDQISEELRLASTGEGANKWILGAFLYRENVEQGFEFVDTGYNVFGPFPIVGNLFVFTNGGEIETTSAAIFGQNDYRFEDGLFGLPTTLSAGLRYTRDEKKVHDFLDFIFFGACAVVVANPDGRCAGKNVENSWNTLTGRAGIQIETTKDVMWYLTASRGYRSGGALVGNFPGTYDPEYIWNYELGVKSTVWDGRLQLNAAAFWNDYSEIQVFIQDIADSRIENAAAATIKGVEVDGVMKPTEDFTLNFGFSWLDAAFDSYRTRENRAELPPALADLSGNRLNRTPEFTLVLGGQYDWAGNWGILSARVDFLWQDEVFFRAQNLAIDRQDAYTKTDLRLIYSAPDSSFKAEAFVQNLEDDDVVNNIVLPAQTLGGPTSQVTLNPPRTFGVRLSAAFGG